MIKAIGKIVRNGQLTVPTQIRKTLHIKDGDFVRFDVKDTHLIVTPVSIVEKDQSYFYTTQWQEEETLAAEDIQKGHVTKTKNLKELFRKLDN